MSRRPPTATRTDPLFPDTTLFRSLARRLAEAAVGTQVEPLGRREDALPLLIFEDGVGQVIGLFEQHMAEPKLRGARGGAEPGRTRADDGEPNRLAHAAAAPTVLPSILLTQARTSIPPPSPSPSRPISGCAPALCP